MYKVIGAIALVIAIISCKKDDGPTNEVNTSSLSCSDVDSTYSGAVQAIVTNNCAISGCHNSSARGGVRLQNYEQISIEASKPRFLAAVKRNRNGGVSPMPPSSPLSAEEVKSIECWISAGTPEN